MRVSTQNDGCEVGDTRYMTEGCGRVGGRPFVDVGIYVRREEDADFAAVDSVRLYLGGRLVPEDLDADDLVRRVQHQQAARDRAADDGSF
ncbi:hypothetical protein Sa4125_00360 [Aureimonas sp. SA4125]|uniref:hypothetical protein n=1 Tax=Aureimonas sp. SA4125 TaxID=2826993 RepID=UPI001CC7AB92|nr:hypothetical protein [Aureimonas sp. SA4125]BDA82494.1 hypothetical protein Sa4125_00360 [Aureimonas sp. SA4125]